MLEANAFIEQVDEETGFVTPEYQESQEILKMGEEVSLAAQYRQMEALKGWSTLQTQLKNQAAHFMNQLKFAEDTQAIYKLQALVLAFEFLPQYIEKVFLDAEKASAILKQYMEGSTPQG